ncbi:MAG: hypothetical protein ACXWQO_01280 [Bdellovibrionota bacterium]
MKLLQMVGMVSLLIPSAAMAGATVHGDAPLFEYPGLQEKIDRTWQYEKKKYLADKEVKDPEIYFFPFDRAQESAEWVTWQNNWILENPAIWLDWTQIEGNNAPKEITKDWVQQNIVKLFPFPKTFRAFHYDGTNRIQISAGTTFLPYYVNDPYGMKVDNIGFGFYTAAHEMLHYTFEQRGIPGRLHHCIFISERPNKKTPIQDAVQFLLDQKISNPYAMFMGADKENDFNPCGALSKDEQALAHKYLLELP